MGRPSREAEVAALEALWRANINSRREERRKQGAPDDIGDAQELRPRPLRSKEIAAALRSAYETTGDPVFDDALRALEAYGFSTAGIERGGRSAHRMIYGDDHEGFLVQVRWYVGRGRTVLAASQQVAAEFGLAGASFNQVTKELARKYREWERQGHPEPEAGLVGDLGYEIVVRPLSRVVAVPGGGALPVDGLAQPATLYWRRRLREGSVAVSHRQPPRE